LSGGLPVNTCQSLRPPFSGWSIQNTACSDLACTGMIGILRVTVGKAVVSPV